MSKHKENNPANLLYPVCCLMVVVSGTLKLAGVINWPWIAVIAPLFIIPSIIILMALIVISITVLYLFGLLFVKYILDYYERFKAKRKIHG
jgi:hypothetical protein